MILSPERRQNLFDKGRSISNWLIGNLFQNEMDLSNEMIDQELENIQHLINNLKSYQQSVQTLKLENLPNES